MWCILRPLQGGSLRGGAGEKKLPLVFVCLDWLRIDVGWRFNNGGWQLTDGCWWLNDGGWWVTRNKRGRGSIRGKKRPETLLKDPHGPFWATQWWSRGQRRRQDLAKAAAMVVLGPMRVCVWGGGGGGWGLCKKAYERACPPPAPETLHTSIALSGHGNRGQLMANSTR